MRGMAEAATILGISSCIKCDHQRMTKQELTARGLRSTNRAARRQLPPLPPLFGAETSRGIEYLDKAVARLGNEQCHCQIRTISLAEKVVGLSKNLLPEPVKGATSRNYKLAREMRRLVFGYGTYIDDS